MVVEINEDSIRILDEDFEEIVGWTKEDCRKLGRLILSCGKEYSLVDFNIIQF